MSIKITYQLTEADLIQGHMYQASQSATIKRQRFGTIWLIPGIYLVTGLFFVFIENNIQFGTFMIVAAVLWFIFYRFVRKRRYARFYRKYIAENQSDKLNADVEIEFTDDYVISKMGMSESKFHVSDIQNVAELSDIVIIRLKGGVGLVIPKRYLSNVEELKSFFHRHNLGFETQLDWKFK